MCDACGEVCLDGLNQYGSEECDHQYFFCDRCHDRLQEEGHLELLDGETFYEIEEGAMVVN